MSRTLACAALILGAGCTFQGTPVPVSGDLALLEGEWEGSYSSRETGRTGSIFFRLKAGTDSAFGDVVMVPNRAEPMQIVPGPELAPTARPLSRALTISFVRCEEGLVTGVLDPYDDPETGERVQTTFEGRLRGDEFRGTFTTWYPRSRHSVTGSWSVKRFVDETGRQP